MKKVIILACSCFLLAACGNSAKTNNSTSADSTATQVADIHNAETSLDYEGTYKGVFPAADCPGIETTLTLNPDKTFTLHSVYIDRDSSFDEKGTINMLSDLLQVSLLVNGSHSRSLVGFKASFFSCPPTPPDNCASPGSGPPPVLSGKCIFSISSSL